MWGDIGLSDIRAVQCRFRQSRGRSGSGTDTKLALPGLQVGYAHLVGQCLLVDQTRQNRDSRGARDRTIRGNGLGAMERFLVICGSELRSQMLERRQGAIRRELHQRRRRSPSDPVLPSRHHGLAVRWARQGGVGVAAAASAGIWQCCSNSPLYCMPLSRVVAC